jgi:hypothetical protein
MSVRVCLTVLQQQPLILPGGDAVDQVLPFLRGALPISRIGAVLIAICFAHGAAAVEADADVGNLSLSGLADVEVTSGSDRSTSAGPTIRTLTVKDAHARSLPAPTSF